VVELEYSGAALVDLAQHKQSEFLETNNNTQKQVIFIETKVTAADNMLHDA